MQNTCFSKLQLVSHCYTAVLYEPISKLYIYKNSAAYLSDARVTFVFFFFFCCFFLLLLLFCFVLFCFVLFMFCFVMFLFVYFFSKIQELRNPTSVKLR